MKIVSFNVNGIRAILKKDFIESFNKLNADIFSLNETKLSEDEFKNFLLIRKDILHIGLIQK